MDYKWQLGLEYLLTNENILMNDKSHKTGTLPRASFAEKLQKMGT